MAEHLGHAFDSIEMEPMLKEITLGDYDGAMGWDALDRQAPEEAAKRRDDPWNYRYPNGESSQDVQDRVRPVFDGLKDADGVVIVVAHGVVNKIIRGLHLNLSTAETFETDRPQDAFYRLHTAGETLIPTDAPASEGGAKSSVSEVSSGAPASEPLVLNSFQGLSGLLTVRTSPMRATVRARKSASGSSATAIWWALACRMVPSPR